MWVVAQWCPVVVDIVPYILYCIKLHLKDYHWNCVCIYRNLMFLLGTTLTVSMNSKPFLWHSVSLIVFIVFSSHIQFHASLPTTVWHRGTFHFRFRWIINLIFLISLQKNITLDICLSNAFTIFSVALLNVAHLVISGNRCMHHFLWCTRMRGKGVTGNHVK